MIPETITTVVSIVVGLLIIWRVAVVIRRAVKKFGSIIEWIKTWNWW